LHTRRADIIIAAAGKPKAVTADMVKEGVVVIDVGVNEIGKTPEGKRILVGDVDYEPVKAKAKAITPVPGGVGPMTITMLMLNTVKALNSQELLSWLLYIVIPRNSTSSFPIGTMKNLVKGISNRSLIIVATEYC
jgi:5,10-methylene-tetrahydrofolate dehydrogenase/methenyl tetrahydrofolate cyclohydrolase